MNFSSKKLENYASYLSDFLQETLKNTKKTGYVLGVSTGIDSTLCAKFLSTSSFENIYLYMFHKRDSEQKKLIKKLEKKFQITVLKINLAPIIKQYQKIFMNQKIKFENLIPRIRMNILYLFANNFNKLVLGTSNFDEWNLGYFTKFGDGASDVQLFLNTPKKVIFLLAKFLKVPKIFIDKPPSADLYEGQTDEKELKFSYEDSFNYFFNQKNNLSKDTVKKIEKWKNSSFHKKNSLNFPSKFLEFFN
ncbi:NAD(+) synthase [symbiont of Argiope bruennichi]|uniref:NAD(+) synthase n=1 Tax=symbiont of Argiope bruennichi TaxID=2810479 RepID=UPI003DA50488